jgi:hypothetical protein
MALNLPPPNAANAANVQLLKLQPHQSDGFRPSNIPFPSLAILTTLWRSTIRESVIAMVPSESAVRRTLL